jgi:dolichol-phosphate mannosyltransferase
VISVVIPVYNEAESLRTLHAELAAVSQREGLEVEVVFVDDGSDDGSWKVIGELSAQDRRVHGIRFRKNFGKAAALSAGFGAVSGKVFLTLDADLQDDPAEIPRFLAALVGIDGRPLDVVSGWKRIRRDPWHKVLPSRVFNWLVGRMTGVRLHDHNCGMKCYRAEVFRACSASVWGCSAWLTWGSSGSSTASTQVPSCRCTNVRYLFTLLRPCCWAPR